MVTIIKKARSHIQGCFEYTQIQRAGKTTLMMCDLASKILIDHDPDEIYANFQIFVDGINCGDSEWLRDQIMRIKVDKLRHKVLIIDEMGQVLPARGYTDKRQTELCAFIWQMPKRDIILMGSDNVGNSADIILRDGMWQTILPRHKKGYNEFGDRVIERDCIDVDVIFNYDRRVMRGIRVHGVSSVYTYFDTDEPVE